MKRKMSLVLLLVLLLQSLAAVTVLAAPPWGPIYHVVQPGEYLFMIARRYGANPWEIARLNNLVNPDLIYPGQVLVIYPAPPPSWVYIVQPGDTLLAIARRFGVSVWDIARVNGIWNLNYIYVGQRLVIPGYN